LAEPGVPLNEVKFYPGSINGPNPEDDPESYSRWFVENQPPSLNENGAIPYNAFGAKKKAIRMVRDADAMNELYTPIRYYFDNDELYPM
jgi:hypothetical protein